VNAQKFRKKPVTIEAMQLTDGEHWPGCHTQHAACLARRVLEEIR